MTDAILWQAPLLLAVGCVAGFLNILAGGGSLLTLPVLLFLGFPAATANGTNRVAIFCQNVFAIAGFRRQGVLPLKLALICTPPALLGAYLGARFAVDVDEELFRRLLALTMLGVLGLLAFDPARRLRVETERFTPVRLAILMITFLGVGFYGGFIQAGVGFLIITGLLVHGFDLVRINAVKVMVIFAFTIVALAVFAIEGKIDYTLGLALAAGNATGGWVATHLAVRKGHAWIRRVVMITVLVFALKLLVG